MSTTVAVLRRVPGAIRLRRLIGHAQHAFHLRFAKRQNMLCTRFWRSPAQLRVLAGPILDFLEPRPAQGELRILLFGCSIGAEPFSIASTLRMRRPELRFRIEAFDIEPEAIAHARRARYHASDAGLAQLSDEFVENTFDRVDDELPVRPNVASHVTFSLGDVLDGRLIDRLGTADIVFAQNFLFHLSRADATRACDHLFKLMKPRSALFVDGADLDLRARLTEAIGLVPCPYELEQIHADARAHRSYAWPNVYWGLEPFDGRRSDALRRYATIFLRDTEVRYAGSQNDRRHASSLMLAGRCANHR